MQKTPFSEEKDVPFYEEEADEDDENEKENKKEEPTPMDKDHRLLLTITKPLLQSRNAAVSVEDFNPQTHIQKIESWA